MVIDFRSLDDIRAVIGAELPLGEWLTITQSRVDEFADVTDDHAWIHVDVERAAAGPFGGTIAHGFLTLALLPPLGRRVYALNMPGRLVNYGLDNVRFPEPVPVGCRVRLRSTPLAVHPHPRGHRIVIHHEILVEQRERPACVVDTIFLLLPPTLPGVAALKDERP